MPAPTPIIILNWNGLADTLECLESVLKTQGTDFIIYLVDNASQDNSQAVLRKQYGKHPKINLIFNKENLGFTRGNNLILRQLLQQPNIPEYIALLNNDTVIEPTWLKNLLQSAKTHQAGIVASKMIDYFEREKMDNAGHMMLNTGEVIPVGHGQPVSNFNIATENIGACAGAALYSTKMLVDIGIFDEHFTTGYEDAEFGIRAVVAGYKSWYEPSAVVYHKMGQSIKKIFNFDYSLSIQKHILYSYFKLMPLPVILLAIPSFLFKYLAMLTINIIFWRKKFLKLMIQSIWGTFSEDWHLIKRARKQFKSNHKRIGTLRLLRKQTFFLWFDVSRFYKYFIQNKPSAFDTYGKVESI